MSDLQATATRSTSPPASASALYAGLILDQAPRALGLMDREAMSPTAGCCDRTYWAWKFVDFPGARFQESLCTLSYLYATRFDGNRYYQNARLLEWIGLGLRFWCSLQHRDGSFDEAYPFERSLAATSFTTFYVGEALEFVRDDLPPDILELAVETMRRAGLWLAHNDETHGFLSNHLAAAAAALLHVHRATGETLFETRSRYFLDKILRHQSSEGWYEEYDGADPGYQTHGSFYLARYWQLTGDEGLASSLGRSMEFLAHFIHPDGSLGGEYASRNTQTYYPAAFEMFGDEHPAAARIAETMRPSVEDGSAAGLRGTDVYNYFPCLNNLVFAHLACVAGSDRPSIRPEEPEFERGIVWFPEAGLARVRRKSYEAFIGSAKGGVIKVFDRERRKLVYSDCGYIGRLVDGRLIASQYQDRGRAVRVESDRIEVEGQFLEVTRPTMTPSRFIAFRLFTLSLGRLAGIGRWLKRRLVKTLIHDQQPVRIRFKRTIEFGETGVNVCDEIGGPDGSRVASLQWGPLFTTIHMGSSRYFIANEIHEPSLEETPHEIEPREIAGGVTLRRTVSFQ